MPPVLYVVCQQQQKQITPHDICTAHAYTTHTYIHISICSFHGASVVTPSARAHSFNHALKHRKWAGNAHAYPNIHTCISKGVHGIRETLDLVLTKENTIKTILAELKSQSDKTKVRDLTRMPRCNGSSSGCWHMGPVHLVAYVITCVIDCSNRPHCWACGPSRHIVFALFTHSEHRLWIYKSSCSMPCWRWNAHCILFELLSSEQIRTWR